MEGLRGEILVNFGGRTELAGVRKARSGWGLRAAAAEEEEAENVMFGLRPLDIRKMSQNRGDGSMFIYVSVVCVFFTWFIQETQLVCLLSFVMLV